MKNYDVAVQVCKIKDFASSTLRADPLRYSLQYHAPVVTGVGGILWGVQKHATKSQCAVLARDTYVERTPSHVTARKRAIMVGQTSAD